MLNQLPEALKNTTKRFLPHWLWNTLAAPYHNGIRRGRLLRFQAENRPRSRVARSWQDGIAVVIPCYNHAVYLEATFASLAAQTYRPFQLICVDDNGSDETASLLPRLCRWLPKGIDATVLRTPRNLGQASALNLAIGGAQASLIMVLNDDDYLMHDALETASEVLRAYQDLYLLGGEAISFSGAGDPKVPEEDRYVRAHFRDYRSIPLKRYYPTDVTHFVRANDINMTHSGCAFFKSAWEAAGGYYSDKARRVVAFSDRDFQIRVTSLCNTAVMRAPLAFWRSDSSVDAGRDT